MPVPRSGPRPTPLHRLRQRLERLAREVETDEGYARVSAMAESPARVEALSRAFARADTFLTGKPARPLYQYGSHVRSLLEGDVWAWHLADGGYSRVRVSLIDGPRDVLALQWDLSLPRVIQTWEAARGGR